MKNLVVCIGSGSWHDIHTGKAPTGPAPKRGEIYTFDGIDENSPSHIYLAEFHWSDITGRCSWESSCFRPVDNTFGEVVAEIIEKQLELEECHVNDATKYLMGPQ